MRKILTVFSLFSMLYLSSCKTHEEEVPAISHIKAESILDFDCLRNSADVPLTIADAKKGIYGEWQLKGMITMAPIQEELPDIKLVITQKNDGKQLAEILKDGKLTNSAIFEFEQNAHEKLKWVSLNTTSTNFTDGSYNFIKGSIRICPGELMIDNGMAFDAPAYLFRKNK